MTESYRPAENVPGATAVSDDAGFLRECAAEEARSLLLEYVRTRDVDLRNRLVLIHSRLVHYFAARLSSGSGSSFEDLVQVGYVGLISALERYDPSHGTSFSTFASPTVAGVIKRYLRDHTWSLKVPRRLRELGVNLRKVRAELEGRLNRSPTLAEIAAETGVSEERVVEAMDLERVYQPVSLDVSRADEEGRDIGNEWRSLGELDPHLAQVDQREALKRAIRALDAREREIIYGRFFGSASQVQMAEKLGISQMHVSRIERHALRKLRALLT